MAEKRRHSWIWVLTDEPGHHGAVVDPVAFDLIKMRERCWVHLTDDGQGTLANVVGEILNVEVIWDVGGHPRAVGLRCYVHWLERLRPGRYEAHVFGLILQRDDAGNATKAEAHGVSVWPAGRGAEGPRVFEVKGDDDG